MNDDYTNTTNNRQSGTLAAAAAGLLTLKKVELSGAHATTPCMDRRIAARHKIKFASEGTGGNARPNCKASTKVLASATTTLFRSFLVHRKSNASKHKATQVVGL